MQTMAPGKKPAKKEEEVKFKEVNGKEEEEEVVKVKEEERGVYLGTKSVEGSGGLASHWAIGVGNNEEELLWMEIDGGGGRQKKRGGKRNTINGHGSSSWRSESPLELMHCGEASRLGAVRSNEVGRTRRSDAEICDFVANYLSKHPTYHMMTENCQDFAFAIVGYMCGQTASLPSRQVAVITYKSYKSETPMM